MSHFIPSHPHAEARAQLERFLRIRLAETGCAGCARRRPSLTLSRQAGLGGRDLAHGILAHLNCMDEDGNRAGWVAVDSELLDTVVERLGGIRTPSDNVPLQGNIVTMFDDRPSSRVPAATSPHPASAAVRRLCELGGAIVVGRGGQCATAGLDRVFRVRLIADRSLRARAFAERCGIRDLVEAERLVDRIDTSRSHYLLRHFGADIDDPANYHLTLNLSEIPGPVAVRMIGDSLLEWSTARDAAADAQDPVGSPQPSTAFSATARLPH